MDADVLVIGGGLAGLETARLLKAGGATVRVLEARDRVGGRTFSRRIGGAVVDVGGQWIGPGQQRVQRLAAELAEPTFPTHHAGTKRIEVDGEMRSYEGAIPTLPLPSLVMLHATLRASDHASATVSPAEPWSAPRAAEWDGMTVETWLRGRRLPAAARGAIDAALRVVFGAEPAELSLLWFLSYAAAGGGIRRLVEIEGGAQQLRFVRGAQSLSKGLARHLDGAVLLERPVVRIVQAEAAVQVHDARGEVHEARRAVLALPPVLAGRIAYEPALPPARDQLTQRMPMGATIKVLALYERAFWREAGLSGEAVSGAGPISVVFDNGSADGAQPCLVGFVVGHHARALSRQGDGARRRAILEALARLLGPQAAEPTELVLLDWTAEPFTGGCPVASFPPGILTQLGGALTAPVGRLHFAGTETAAEWTGYMEGALASAERAASEVLAALA